MNKSLLLASFIFPERKAWFFKYLTTKFKVNVNDIFTYENVADASKLIIVFKLSIPQGTFMDLKNLFPNAVQIHKKGHCLYSINALNKLITNLTGDSKNTKDFKMNWSEHQDKMILLSNNELSISDIKQVF